VPTASIIKTPIIRITNQQPASFSSTSQTKCRGHKPADICLYVLVMITGGQCLLFILLMTPLHIFNFFCWVIPRDSMRIPQSNLCLYPHNRILGWARERAERKKSISLKSLKAFIIEINGNDDVCVLSGGGCMLPPREPCSCTERFLIKLQLPSPIDPSFFSLTTNEIENGG
jgi:hypothetical protein